MSLVDRIEEKGLVGRGGARFPVARKWRIVRDTDGDPKYVVCNAAEGEPGVFKDEYILENYPDRVVDGIKLALDVLKAERAYIYINRHYYNEFGEILKRKFGGHPIEFFLKPKGSGYIGGEETAILNIIEGGRSEPRLRPPFPPESGLWECPTLVHNVETFYDISLVSSGDFRNDRFYSITGDCAYPGVYKSPAGTTIEKLLRRTGNWPEHDFFVQVGGDASGEVLNQKQLKRRVPGAGSVHIYQADKYGPKKILDDWMGFFLQESCGKCTPCREGIYRAKEVLSSSKTDWGTFHDLMVNLRTASFCGLGCAAEIPVSSYLKNVVIPGYGPRKGASSREVKEVRRIFENDQ